MKKQVRVVMPEPVYQKIKRYCGGNQTRFILEAVHERLRVLEHEELTAELREGYGVRNEERRRWAEGTVALAAEILEPAPEGE